MSFLSPLPHRLSADSRPRSRVLKRSLSAPSLSLSEIEPIPLQHPHLRPHYGLPRVRPTRLTSSRATSLSKQYYGIRTQMNPVAPAQKFSLSRAYSTQRLVYVRPQTSTRYSEHHVYPMDMKLDGYNTKTGLGGQTGPSFESYEPHYSYKDKLSDRLSSGDPLFVDTNFSLSLGKDYRLSSVKPLSSEHLLSLARNEAQPYINETSNDYVLKQQHYPATEFESSRLGGPPTKPKPQFSPSQQPSFERYQPIPPQRSSSTSRLSGIDYVTGRITPSYASLSHKDPPLYETPIRFRTDPLFEQFEATVPHGIAPNLSRNYSYQTTTFMSKPLPPLEVRTPSPVALTGGRVSPFVSPKARGLAPPPTDQPIRNPVRHGIEGEVDGLTIQMLNNMYTGKGAAGEPYQQHRVPHQQPQYICAKCGDSIGPSRGCTALNQTFHVDCFKCIVCGTKLTGIPFYAVDNKPYCEKDYQDTLEKCSICYKPVVDRILRASGKAYHPSCFTCTVCGKALDGVPFTVDTYNATHCVDCYHEKYAPRCAACRRPIVPESGKEESLRVVAMDKSYHIDCYRCEDCGLRLSSQMEGCGCYPLDDHILCKNCNAERVRMLTSK